MYTKHLMLSCARVSLASTFPQVYALLGCYAASLGNWFLTL